MTAEFVMGMLHKAKKGTIIEANGVRISVIRGSPLLEISAPTEVPIRMRHEHSSGGGESRQRQEPPTENWSQSIDWYAEGQRRTVEVNGVRVVVRFIGRKGRRGRIAIEAPAGAVFRTT